MVGAPRVVGYLDGVGIVQQRKAVDGCGRVTVDKERHPLRHEVARLRHLEVDNLLLLDVKRQCQVTQYPAPAKHPP